MFLSPLGERPGEGDADSAKIVCDEKHRMTHLTYPTLTRGSPSSPPASAGGEDVRRRWFLLGAAGFTLTGCFDKPWYEENPQQKAFLAELQAVAKPALASNNPLRLEEATKQSLALAAKIGAFTEWQGILRTIEGNAQKMAVSIDIGPQVSLYAFNDWALGMAGAVADLFSTRSRDSPPAGLSDQAIAALKTFRLNERLTLSGRFGQIAGAGLFDLSSLFGKSDADNRQFLQVPRFVARIDSLVATKKK
jgi:hypothetical protein